MRAIQDFCFFHSSVLSFGDSGGRSIENQVNLLLRDFWEFGRFPSRVVTVPGRSEGEDFSVGSVLSVCTKVVLDGCVIAGDRCIRRRIRTERIATTRGRVLKCTT